MGELLGVMEIFYTLFVVIVTPLSTFAKAQSILHLKWVHFIICKVYLKRVG